MAAITSADNVFVGISDPSACARLATRALFAVFMTVSACAAAPAGGAAAQALEPIVYTIRVPSPATHVAQVDAVVPTDGRATVEMMMPVWSPGYYVVQDYAGRVLALSARAADGTALKVERPQPNRWTIHAGGRPTVTVSYGLRCEQRSVTTNWVSPELGVFNGAATFITLAERRRRPHQVHIDLPPAWKRAMTGMDPAPGGQPNHYRADDYEALVDSPIIAGDLTVHEFTVEGTSYALVDAGDVGRWNGKRASDDLAKLARQDRQLWGLLPFARYVVFNLFRPGGGGLEHRNSALLTADASAATKDGYHDWLVFVSHEYFHAYNGKRLRPVDLGPFDFEKPAHTPSLWVTEGLTDYYAILMLARAGLIDRDEFLSRLSWQIGTLQNAPGRRRQTLEQSSEQVWTNSTSGVNEHANTVSYYVKGAVVGFLLDARIRHATSGARSLDDVLRLAYQRYSGARGFTEEQFRATASEVAGVDLRPWFLRTIGSTDELGYGEAVGWYGLFFESAPNPKARWNLAVRPRATPEQRRQLQALLAPDRGR